MATAKRHWFIKGTAELNQPMHVRDVLVSELKLGNVLCWKRGYALVSTENKKLWLSPKLTKIIFDWGRPENLTTDKKKEKLGKTTGQVTSMLTILL